MTGKWFIPLVLSFGLHAVVLGLLTGMNGCGSKQAEIEAKAKAEAAAKEKAEIAAKEEAAAREKAEAEARAEREAKRTAKKKADSAKRKAAETRKPVKKAPPPPSEDEPMEPAEDVTKPIDARNADPAVPPTVREAADSEPVRTTSYDREKTKARTEKPRSEEAKPKNEDPKDEKPKVEKSKDEKPKNEKPKNEKTRTETHRTAFEWYHVKAGDSWTKIARAHGCTLQDLATLNGRDARRLGGVNKGARIKVPLRNAVAPETP